MKVMSIRDFLRGGYRNLTEGTIVMRHGQPFLTVMPHLSGKDVARATTVKQVVDTVKRV